MVAIEQRKSVERRMADDLVFYTNPMSRGRIVRWMLEEVGQPYRTEVLDYASTMKAPAYRAINPMGKVPAIRHRGALVTEQAAITIYLADLYPTAGLAPKADDPLRGPYLRWLVFYGSSFEPAVVDHALKREPGPAAMSPYGDSYERVIDIVAEQLRTGPYLLGERFTAADVLWGMALNWTTMFKVVPERPEFMAYIERTSARPAVAKVREIDARLAAEHEAALAE
jgi:glutathione S-transferase